MSLCSWGCLLCEGDALVRPTPVRWMVPEGGGNARWGPSDIPSPTADDAHYTARQDVRQAAEQAWNQGVESHRGGHVANKFAVNLGSHLRLAARSRKSLMRLKLSRQTPDAGHTGNGIDVAADHRHAQPRGLPSRIRRVPPEGETRAREISAARRSLGSARPVRTGLPRRARRSGAPMPCRDDDDLLARREGPAKPGAQPRRPPAGSCGEVTATETTGRRLVLLIFAFISLIVLIAKIKRNTGC